MPGRSQGRRRRVARRRALSTTERRVLGTLGVLVVLAVWQVTSWAGLLNPLVGSSPLLIAEAAVQMVTDGTLASPLLSTARLFAVGFGISLGSGLVIGLVTGWYARVQAVFDPWIGILYTVPLVALVPVITVWAGIGFRAQVVVVWLISVWPVILNTQAAIASMDRDHFQLARSLMATDAEVLRTIALPGALPGILTGVRQGLMQALVGCVVAEYFIGNTGVGGLIITAGLTLDTARAFVGALVFAVAALLMTAVLRRVEHRYDRWRG